MENKLFITITIDTENPQNALVNNLYHTNTLLYSQERDYGVSYLLKLFQRYGVRATWYLNVYEKYLWGDKAIGRLCEILKRNSQDIQLHTHPVWLMDKENRKKIFMSHYSLEEQIHILEIGKEDIFRLSGEKPIAHRAGGYGANKETLMALKCAQIPIDSSLFMQSPNCEVWSKYSNCCHVLDDVWEFPVTTYRIENYSALLERIGTYINKTDINFSSIDDLILCCEQMKKQGVQYMNLFMHSFSLYKFFTEDISSDKICYDAEKKVIRRLIAFLEYASKRSGIEIITVSELQHKYSVENKRTKTKEYIPTVKKIRRG